MNDQVSRFKICPGWNRDEFDKCMDAKLSEEEREVKEGQETKRQKAKKKEEKKEEEKGKEMEEEISKKQIAAAGEIEEDMMREGAINENVRRRLKLELRRLTQPAKERANKY